MMFWNRMYLEGDEPAGRENMTPNLRAELRARIARRGAQKAHGESLDEGARAAGRRRVDGVPQDEQEQVRRVAERRLNVAEHPHEREQ